MYYVFHQISDRVYQITCPEQTNTQLIVGDRQALVFDTGYGFGPLREEIEKVTSLPLVVVNSHGHLDHINGNHQFDGPIYIHEKDHALALEHSSSQYRKNSVEQARHTLDHFTGKETNVLPEGFDENAYCGAKLPDYTFVREGHVFDLGGAALQVVELPGHTQGSIGLWYPAEKLLFIGDAFCPFTWLFAEEACTLSEYKKTLAKAKAIGAEKMLGGHEEGIITPEDLDAYIDCAQTADFERGLPWEPPLLTASGNDVRVCVRPGYEPFQFDKKGYASIVISRDHMK